MCLVQVKAAIKFVHNNVQFLFTGAFLIDIAFDSPRNVLLEILRIVAIT